MAFTAASNQSAESAESHPRRPSYGEETVYLLRGRAHAAIPVHRERIAFAACERWAALEWHGHWLLYSAAEGNLAVIDTTGVHRTIELRSLISTLPGTRDGFTAYWSGQPTAL